MSVEKSPSFVGENSQHPSKILIVLHGAIGDVTRALPLASRIKHFWPEVELHWAIEPISRSLVDGHPAIDKIVVFDRPRGFSAYRSFIRELRSENYDVVLDMQRHFKSGITSWLSGAHRRLGFHYSNAREGNWIFSNEKIDKVDHLSWKLEHFQLFGDVLGLPRMSPLEFGLSPLPDEVARIEALVAEQCNASEKIPPVGLRVALILGSTWESRFWTSVRYEELIKILYTKWSIRCVLVGSSSEKEFAEEIYSRCEGQGVINLVEKTTLRELVPLFSRVRLAVGSDSGPMHIAAAVGLKVVSLWGSTSPKRSYPYGSESYVLQSPIGCSPCYRRKCPGLNTICMSDIPAQAVVAHIENIMNDSVPEAPSPPGVLG